MKNKQPDCQTGKPQSRQLIITLNVPESSIVRIEGLDQSGERYDVPDTEFASLAGDYVVEDLRPVSEHAYFSGFYDEGEDFELDDCEDEFDGGLGPVAARNAESRRLIPSQARTLILDHLLRQRFLKRLGREQFLPHWEIVFSVRVLLH